MQIWRTLVVLTALGGPALAQDQQSPPGQGGTSLACTNAGSQYKVGEFACIAACHQQRRLARCDVVSEKASWTYVSEACPSAMIINPPWPSDWTEVPAVAAMSPVPVVVNYSALPPEMPRLMAALLR